MKKIFSAFLALLLIACCTPQPQPVPAEEDPVTPPEEKPVVQEDAPYLSARADVKAVLEPGSLVTVAVRSNYGWAYGLSEELFDEYAVTDSTLVLSSKLNIEADKTVSITIMSDKDRSLTSEVKVKVKSALMVDFVFEDDGTAKDASPNSYWIDTKEGVNMLTYYNASAGRNVVKFFSSLGGTLTDGFYKFDYNSSKPFVEGLSDGHSMEVIFMLGEEPGSVGEIKMFSSMEQGGTGFLITDQSRGRVITFLPNTTDEAGKNWRWCTSGIVPEVGRYYHVVGVWDKQAGKARVYVDGELCNTVAAAGSFNLPNGAASRWFCVGGDPSGASCQSAWNGDVVLARVYDAVLDDASAAELWAKAPKNIQASSVKITNVLYLPECEVKPNGKFTVAGDGFVTGDIIRLEGDEIFSCETEILSDRAVVTIPSDFKGGSYKMMAVRGAEAAPLGAINLTVTESPRGLFAPKVIAHRGFHGSGRPENSIAALKAAQDGGFYGSEMDVWMTTDGVLYVNHDGVISGKTIQNCTSADLAGITLSNGEPLPTFRQYLEQFAKNTNTRLIIEIKSHSSNERNLACTVEMLKEVDEFGLAAYVDYISFDRGVCEAIASRKPGSIVGYLTSTSDLEGMLAKGINCADFAYNYLFSNRGIFDKAHSLGMQVNIWTVNSTSDMMRAIGLGADFITTDKPDVLQGIVERLF